MTGYIRKDTTNNIADGNVINATDLDNEFDGVQAAFVVATGHTHDGTASEGAAITKIGPVQDVVVSIASMSPKTTNTIDLGTSSLKYKDAFFAGNETVGGTLAVTGVTTLTAQPVLSSLTASQAVFTDASKGLVSNAITGTGNVVMSTSPTLVTPVLGAASATSLTVTGGTANGVTYLNASKVLTSGTALTFDGTNVANTGGVFISKAPGAGFYGQSDVGASTGFLGFNQYTGVTLSSQNTNPIKFEVNSAEGMRLTSTGLGIGTSSPGERLHVSNSSAADVALQVQNNTHSSYLRSDGTGTQIGTNSATKPIYFYVGAAQRLTLDSSGNLGLGVTPSAWALAGVAAMQLKNASVWGYANSAYVLANGYTISDGNINYIASDAVTLYKSGNGQHSWSAAPSGTAGTTATLTQLMTLDASGNLGIGETSPATYNKLTVNDNIGLVNSNTAKKISFWSTANGNSENAKISVNNNGATTNTGVMSFWTKDGTTLNQAMTLDSSGNLTLGAAAAGTNRFLYINGVVNKAGAIGFQESGVNKWLVGNGAASENGNFEIYDAVNGNNLVFNHSGNLGLGVVPSAWATLSKGLEVGTYGAVSSNSSTGGAYLSNNAYLSTNNDTTGWVYETTNGATLYKQGLGFHQWSIAPSGTADNPITFTQAMTLDASGRRMLGVTTAYGIDTVSTTLVNGTSVATNISDFNGAISVIHNQDNGAIGNKNGLFFAHAGSPGILSGIASTKTANTWQTTLDFYVNNITGVNTGDIQLAARIDSAGNFGIGTSSPATALSFPIGTNKYVGQTRVTPHLAGNVGSIGFGVDDGGGQTGVFVHNTHNGTYSSQDIRFVTAEGGISGATVRAIIDKTGNLGLGVTPSAKFDVQTSSGRFQVDAFGGASVQIISSAAMGYKSALGNGHLWNIDSTQAMTLDANGSLLMSNASGDAVIGSRVSGAMYLGGGTANTTNIVFQVGASERARIDASGNLLVGQTSWSFSNNGTQIQANGRIFNTSSTDYNFELAGAQNGRLRFYTSAGGSGTTVGSITVDTTNTLYNTSSDYRLKNITGPITTSGAYIDSLNPVEGTWKADGSTFVGLIAHETQEASRTTVATGTKDGEQMQGMDYSSAEIIANLIAELQSVRTRLAALEAK